MKGKMLPNFLPWIRLRQVERMNRSSCDSIALSGTERDDMPCVALHLNAFFHTCLWWLKALELCLGRVCSANLGKRSMAQHQWDVAIGVGDKELSHWVWEKDFYWYQLSPHTLSPFVVNLQKFDHENCPEWLRIRDLTSSQVLSLIPRPYDGTRARESISPWVSRHPSWWPISFGPSGIRKWGWEFSPPNSGRKTQIPLRKTHPVSQCV